VKFTIYDFNQAPVMNSSYIGVGETYSSQYLTGHMTAKYTLEAQRDPGGAQHNSEYNFSLFIYPQNDGGQNGDAGDTILDPTNVSTDTHFTGEVGDADPSDFYTFQGHAGQQLKVFFAVDRGADPGFLVLETVGQNPLAQTPPTLAGTESNFTYNMTGDGPLYLEAYSGIGHHGGGMSYQVNMTTHPLPQPDTVPPTVAITYPAQGALLSNSSVTVTGTASDNVGVATVEVALNGGPKIIATGTVQWSLPLVLSVGANNITAYASDAAGNKNSTTIAVTVNRSGAANDTEPPVISITSPADGAVLANASVEVRGVSSDNKGVLRNELSINSMGWVVVPGITSWAFNVSLITGKNTITARAVDLSGNSNLTTILAYVTLSPGSDALPPVVTIFDPLNGMLIPTKQYVVRGNASDETGLLKVDVNINGSGWKLASQTLGSWSPWSYPATFNEGNNSIGARATDTSGNAREFWINVSVKVLPVNNTPPSINITYPLDGAILGTRIVMVQGQAMDDIAVAKVEVSINSGTWELASGTTTWQYNATLLAGTNIIKARATDSGGLANVTQIGVFVNASINDTTQPMITIISPKNNTKFSSDSIDVRGVALDNVGVARVTLDVNGKLFTVTGTVSWSAKVTLKEGVNVIHATAYDAAGNVNISVIHVTYEKPKAPIPAFDAIFLLAAIAVGLVVLNRRRA
jgi:hypothetical protein